MTGDAQYMERGGGGVMLPYEEALLRRKRAKLLSDQGLRDLENPNPDAQFISEEYGGSEANPVGGPAVVSNRTLGELGGSQEETPKLKGQAADGSGGKGSKSAKMAAAAASGSTGKSSTSKVGAGVTAAGAAGGNPYVVAAGLALSAVGSMEDQQMAEVDMRNLRKQKRLERQQKALGDMMNMSQSMRNL